MFSNTSDVYERRYVIATSNDLNEKVHINVYTCKGEVVANVSVCHDGDDSFAVIGVSGRDLIQLGKRLESYQLSVERNAREVVKKDKVYV